jgi:crotonobetainyl-CoA:carnitine CoA-transferase CaiB-like acyl-CoA transferase
VETPGGQVPALLPPGQSDAFMGPLPSIGEHTQSILAELGLAD